MVYKEIRSNIGFIKVKYPVVNNQDERTKIQHGQNG